MIMVRSYVMGLAIMIVNLPDELPVSLLFHKIPLDVCVCAIPLVASRNTIRFSMLTTIGLYREYAIAIQDEVGDSNGGKV